MNYFQATGGERKKVPYFALANMPFNTEHREQLPCVGLKTIPFDTGQREQLPNYVPTNALFNTESE